MATTQTFGGGVHPREIGNGKSATQSQQIVNAAAPARVTIAMAQHGGAPAVCCVKVGQIVNMGQMIGEAAGIHFRAGTCVCFRQGCGDYHLHRCERQERSRCRDRKRL